MGNWNLPSHYPLNAPTNNANYYSWHLRNLLQFSNILLPVKWLLNAHTGDNKHTREPGWTCTTDTYYERQIKIKFGSETFSEFSICTFFFHVMKISTAMPTTLAINFPEMFVLMNRFYPSFGRGHRNQKPVQMIQRLIFIIQISKNLLYS